MTITQDFGVQSSPASSAPIKPQILPPGFLTLDKLVCRNAMTQANALFTSTGWISKKKKGKKKASLCQSGFTVCWLFWKSALGTDCQSWGKELLKIIGFFWLFLFYHFVTAMWIFIFIYLFLYIFSDLECLWDGKSCISDVCFWKQQPILTIKEMDDFMKPSMFCHYAQAIKRASIKQLLALTLNDYWEQTECAVQRERCQLSVWSRRMKSYAFTKIPVTRWFEFFFFFYLWWWLCDLHFSWRQTSCIS